MKLLFWLVIFSLSPSLSWGTSCAESFGQGFSDQTLVFRGVSRSYCVFNPFTLREQPRNLVIALHGGGGNRTTIETMSKLSLRARLRKFILVYPEGTGSSLPDGTVTATWNGGTCCGDAVKQNVDDVGFISALIDKLRAVYPASANGRVFVLGHSNGAIMTYRLACELSNKIDAIAPVGSIKMINACVPSRPVPTLHIHGTGDPCAPYEGGSTGGGCWNEFLKRLTGLTVELPTQPVTPVPDFIEDSWVPLMGAGGSATSTYQSGTASCQEWRGSQPRSVVQFCPISGMGHVWPAGHYAGPCTDHPFSNACRIWVDVVKGPSDRLFPNNDLNGNEAILNFFDRF